MFKDTYKAKFDAIHPDPKLRQAIEERMNEMQYGNEKRRTHTGMSRRMIAVLAAVLVLMLAATAYAVVVRGNLLRTKIENEGDETILAQVQDLHIEDAEGEFSFTIDEVVWEDSKMYLSYTVSVPDDGNSYLCGIYVPELNGERLSYNLSCYFNEPSDQRPEVHAIGGKFPNTVSWMLEGLHVDASLKGRTDNELQMKVVFFKTDRPIESVDWDTYLGMTGYSEGNASDLILPNADVLYYDDVAEVPPRIMLTDYPEVAALFPKRPDFAFGATWEEVDPADLMMTAERFASTGIAEIVDERELTIPLNVSETKDTVYNDVTKHFFQMDGYSIEITEFHLTHLGANFRMFIRKDGELAENFEKETVPIYWELLWPDGTTMTRSENNGTSTAGAIYGERNGLGTDRGIWIDYEAQSVLALDGLTELVIAPATYEIGDDYAIVATTYDLGESITITPVYNPQMPE